MLSSKYFSALSAVVVTASAVFAASGAQAQERIPGEYLVKYKNRTFTTMLSLKSTPSMQIADHNAFGNLLKVRINGAQEISTLVSLLKNPNVEYVVPNIKLHAQLQSIESVDAAVGTAGLQEQWANKTVGVEKAWSLAGNKGAKKVKVAVIDTGMDYNHPSLKTNAIAGYDFRDGDADPMDLTSQQNPGHGTHCSGSIGGNGLADGGIVGASAEVSIMPLRFLGADGSGDLNNGIKAIDHAIQQGASVISASWGATVSRSQAQPLVDAVQRASNAGVIMVMAAANDGRNNDQTEVFPTNAEFDNTISVAASGPNDEKPSWSNFGKGTVHLASPGLDIMSTLPSNKYGKLSGTSMATPLVSGIVAFLKAQDPSLTGAQIRALLQVTGAKANIEVACGCRVDMAAATQAVLSRRMFITPAAATIEPGATKNFTATYGKAPFSFTVKDANIGDIDANGRFTAKAEGETTLTVTDAAGARSESLAIRVAKASTGGGGGGGGDCPLGDEATCQAICGIMPDLPWCK